MNSILEKQVGGTHYKKAFQPIQLYEHLEISQAAFLSNIIKYISRYKQKNGVQDLEKAKHYLEFLKTSKDGGLDNDILSIKHYSEANGFSIEQQRAMAAAWLFYLHGDPKEFEHCMQNIDILIKELV